MAMAMANETCGSLSKRRASSRVGKRCIKGVRISLRFSGFVLQERTNSAVHAGPSEFEGTFYSPQRQTDSHGQNGANSAFSAKLALPLDLPPQRHVGYCSPRCPAAQGKLLTPGARWCPRPVPTPIACSAGTTELHGAVRVEGEGRVGQSGRETTSFHSNACNRHEVSKLMRRHARSPGGAPGAST